MKQNWTYKKLGEIGKISSGKSIPSNAILEEYSDGLYPCYGGNGLRGYVKEYLYDGTYPIIGRVGALCGNVHLVIGKFYPTEHALVMSLKGNDYPNYIEYLLKSLNLNQFAKGVAQPVLSATTLSEIEVLVPTLAEQQRIVSELDLLQGIMDKQQAQLKELDTLAQTVFYDMFGDPVENEKGWEVKRLEEVCAVVKGLVNPNEEPYCNYPHIGGANIQSNTGEFIDVKLAKDENLISGKYLFDETMILYSKIRPNLNKVALPTFTGICSADMYPIIADLRCVNKYFIKHTLTHKHFIEYAISHSGRANIPKINREDLLAYEMPVPPLPLQQEFAEKIEKIEKQKATIAQSIAETQKLFDYTMDKYFN